MGEIAEKWVRHTISETEIDRKNGKTKLKVRKCEKSEIEEE